MAYFILKKKFSTLILIFSALIFSITFSSCKKSLSETENQLYETLKQFVYCDVSDTEKINQIMREIQILIFDFKNSDAFKYSEQNNFGYFSDIEQIEKTCLDFSDKKISLEQTRDSLLIFILEFYKKNGQSFEHISILVFMILIITCVLFLSAFFIVILFIQTQQKVLQTESIINAQEGERNRIAYELHDTVAQDIRAEQLFVTELISHIRQTKKNSDVIEKVSYLEKRILKNIRNIIKNLSLPKFEQMTFTELLENFCHETASFNNITCPYFVQSSILIENLNAEKKLNIFRIIQEAFNNSIKHSESKEVSVQIREDLQSKKIIIFISDNGKGFDSSKENSPNSFGLRGMKSRAELIHADLEINSEIDSGTTVRLEIKA